MDFWQFTNLTSLERPRSIGQSDMITEESFPTAIENHQTYPQTSIPESSNPIVHAQTLVPIPDPAAQALVPKQQVTSPRKRRRSRTKPFPGYMCFPRGSVAAGRERHRRNDDFKQNKKEVIQAGGSCFLCILDKKKVRQPYSC